MRTFAIVNRKGGVGKTTTAAAMQGIHHASGTLPVACKKAQRISAHAALTARVAFGPKRRPSGRA